MNNALTWEQNVRVEALKAAVQQYNGVEFDGLEVTLEAAKKFEEYILDDRKDSIQILSSPAELWVTSNNPVVDLTGCEIAVGADDDGHTHLPVQHRDFKEKWCNTCGLNRHGMKPVNLQAKE